MSIDLQVDWGQKPLWQSALPLQVYGSETLHLFAKFAKRSEYVPVLTWESAKHKGIAKPEILS